MSLQRQQAYHSCAELSPCRTLAGVHASFFVVSPWLVCSETEGWLSAPEAGTLVTAVEKMQVHLVSNIL